MAVNIAHGRIEDELVHRLMHQRIIVLGEALEEGNGNRLMHQLLLLSAEDPRADISLWINSPGGSVSAMLAIHDVMRLVPNDVGTHWTPSGRWWGSGIPRPAGESRTL